MQILNPGIFLVKISEYFKIIFRVARSKRSMYFLQNNYFMKDYITSNSSSKSLYGTCNKMGMESVSHQ